MKDLSLHILDISGNSIRANAKNINISIVESIKNNLIELEITDDGTGMNEQMLSNVRDPFFTTRKTRRVGMGIPLLAQNAEQAGGVFTIKSTPGKGTSVYASFKYNNIDSLPIGDMPATLISIISGLNNTELSFVYKTDDNIYQFNTVEIKNILEDINLNDPGVLNYLKAMFYNEFNKLRTNAKETIYNSYK